MNKQNMELKAISYLLRIALAFAFLYPPISAFLNPDAWVWYVPDFIGSIIAKDLFLVIFGFIEIIIALAIMTMRDPFYPSLTAIILLILIVALNPDALDITFRDISILLSAIALIVLHKSHAKVDSIKQSTEKI